MLSKSIWELGTFVEEVYNVEFIKEILVWKMLPKSKLSERNIIVLIKEIVDKVLVEQG